MTITNLVFQGGSVKGVAYIGVLESLENKLDMSKILRVAGTSAGAITATLLALGCDVPQVKNLLLEFDFKAILDDAEGAIATQQKALKSVGKAVEGKSLFFSKIPVKPLLPVLAHRMMNEFGIYSGEYIRLWIETLIQEQVKTITAERHSGENLTFGELHQLTLDYPGRFRDLAVVGANFTTGNKAVFRYDDPEMKDVIISDAVRISMSIPQVFKPHHVYYKENDDRLIDAKGEMWVDGGLYDNYPIDCFDAPEYTESGSLSLSNDSRRLYNPQTLGFRLVSKERKDYWEGVVDEAPQNQLAGILDYGKAILGVRADLQEERYAHPENKQRTVYIDHQGISMLEFNLSESQQQDLMLAGRTATEDYFTRHAKLESTSCGQLSVIRAM